jgi:hypothetical protein
MRFVVVVPTAAGGVSPAVKGIVFGELDMAVNKNRVRAGHVPVHRLEIALRNGSGPEAGKGIGGHDAPSVLQRLADRNHIGWDADGGFTQCRRCFSEGGRIGGSQSEDLVWQDGVRVKGAIGVGPAGVVGVASLPGAVNHLGGQGQLEGRRVAAVGGTGPQLIGPTGAHMRLQAMKPEINCVDVVHDGPVGESAGFTNIHVQTQPELSEIAFAPGRVSLGFGLHDGRQKERCQNRDDGDDDEQFDQSKRLRWKAFAERLGPLHSTFSGRAKGILNRSFRQGKGIAPDTILFVIYSVDEYIRVSNLSPRDRKLSRP